MVHAWGGYTNGQIPLSALVEVPGTGQYFEPDMANRMAYLLSQVNVHINEGYRPLGSEPDQYVTNEANTSTGGSNQWFQWGRFKRGETPSAGTPGTSSHGWGLAADINPGRGNPQVAEICAQLGLIFTVASESWHVAADGTPTIPYLPAPIRKKKEMLLVNNGQAEYLIGQEYIHHITRLQDAVLQEVYAPLVWKSGADFDAILDAFGVPRDKPAAVLGGKTWSRVAEIHQGGTSGTFPTTSAIAKAVNDDAAKRLSA